MTDERGERARCAAASGKALLNLNPETIDQLVITIFPDQTTGFPGAVPEPASRKLLLGGDLAALGLMLGLGRWRARIG